MSFGFSISDIISVVGIGFNVCTAIRGSPAEHQQLVLQLEAFRQSLLHMEDLVANLEASPIATSVSQQLSRCQELLQGLHETNTRYVESSRSRNGIYQRRKSPFKELQWAIYKRGKTMGLVDDLSRQIGALMATYQIMIFGEVKATVEMRLPASLDERPDSKRIQFIDALDRETKIDFKLCEKWEDFHDYLKFHFRKSAGRSWVDAGRYEVVDETTGAILTAKEWNSRIKPGMAVSMAMLLQKRGIFNTTDHNCPGCDSPYEGAIGKVLERVQCKYCAVWFQISSKSRIEELGDDYDEPDSLDVSAEKQLVRSGSVGASFDIDEVRFFRRLHVLQEKFKPQVVEWLTLALVPLQKSYIQDNFEGVMLQTAYDVLTDLPAIWVGGGGAAGVEYRWIPRIRCHDCPGKIYTPGPDQTVDNFLMHLKNRGHRERVGARVNKMLKVSHGA